MNSIELRPTYWASVSGGKDSLYMLKLILDNLDRYPLNGVVHYELDIDYPFIKDVIDYMQSECDRYRIPFLRIKPQKTFEELYKKYGFPTRKVRWCNKEYKLSAARKLEDFMRSRGERVIHYIGFCADEARRFKAPLYGQDNVRYIYPLAEFGIQEREILEWAKTVPLFNDFYKYNRRCGCMLCPMMTMKESAYLLKYYPEHWNTMMRMAKETEERLEERFGRPKSVWHGEARYNTEYRMKKVREYWLPLLEKEIENDG